MKKLVTFVTILFSQTLLETIDLPPGGYWNYGYGMVYGISKYWVFSSSSSAGNGIIKAVDNTGAEVILRTNFKRWKAVLINCLFLFLNY